MKLWIKRIFQILGVLALIGILYAAFTPLPFDPELPKGKMGRRRQQCSPRAQRIATRISRAQR